MTRTLILLLALGLPFSAANASDNRWEVVTDYQVVEQFMDKDPIWADTLISTSGTSGSGGVTGRQIFMLGTSGSGGVTGLQMFHGGSGGGGVTGGVYRIESQETLKCSRKSESLPKLWMPISFTEL
jgi:hypothetical protein